VENSDRSQAFRLHSASDVDHGSGCRHETGFPYVVALFLELDYRADIVGKFGVGCPSSHAPCQVMVEDREETGANLAVRGNANAAAGAAERVRNRSDNSDFTNAVERLSSGAPAVPAAASDPVDFT